MSLQEGMTMKKRNGSRDRMVKMEHPTRRFFEASREPMNLRDARAMLESAEARVVEEPCDCPQCERERRER